MRKRFLGLIVSTLIMVLMMGVCANAENKTGSCGDSATYSFDTVTGTLTINGTGSIDKKYKINDYDIKRVIINEGITSIGNYVFSGCEGITDITIPNSVTSIEFWAFEGCKGLKNIRIPDSVTNIGYYAFSGCTGLTNVRIPQNVTLMGNDVFSECTGLKSAGPIGSGCNIEFGWTKAIPDNAISGCAGLTSITIPNSVTSIGNYAFKDCKGLTGITIPNSVSSIGWSTFEGCEGLKSVTISNSISTIPVSAFKGCKGLTGMTIPDSITAIERSAFEGCAGLKSIVIPNSISSIPDVAFSGCTGLTSIKIPDSVTSIGTSAFRECTSLTAITIPDGVNTIGGGAFAGCDKLASIKIPNGVATVESGIFRGCTGLTSITIPDKVTYIGGEAFFGCTGLTGINIPNGVNAIWNSAFSGCTGLTNITIPDSVTTIKSEAFSNCTNLNAVTISHNTVDIGPNVFKGCNNLTINGYDNTEAQRYALGNSIKYNSLGIAYNVTFSTRYGALMATKETFLYIVGEKYKKFPELNFKELGKLSFVGWFTEKEGGTQITEDTVCTLTGDTTLYAHWEEVDATYKVKQFVNRLYSILLDREAERDGLDNWSAKLLDGSANAAQIVEGIVNSQEFTQKGLNNAEVVERMYQAMLGRASDEGGKNHWTDMLNKGLSVNTIINGFSGSAEFGNICNNYGINPGSISLGEPRDQNEGIAAFVARCYEKALGRTFEKDGINNWCKEILDAPDKKKRAEEVASDGFFHSQEFANKNTSNDEYVEILYRTFLGREYDEAGKADWVGKLNSGVSRDEVLYGFSRSAEFANIMSQYGL